jgi:hypothetical protein
MADGSTPEVQAGSLAQTQSALDDAGCDIEQLLGIADLLTCVSADELADGTLARVGYAIEGILERVQARLRVAQGPSEAECEVLCRGLELVRKNCNSVSELALATRLLSKLEVPHG